MRVEEMVPTILPPMPGSDRECTYLNWRAGDAWTDPEAWHWISYDINRQRWFCSCPWGERYGLPCEHVARVRLQLWAEKDS